MKKSQNQIKTNPLVGLINHTRKSNKLKEEKGITLIALLVTVILLVILVGVAVSQITGDEGIIVGTEEAVDDYKYQQYKEQIEQLVHSIILADSLAGRTTTVTSMAEDMENESWIKSAVPNEESKDIIVTVQEGYVYQVYYDELTGMSSVDNIGTEDGASLPTVTATYNKETYTIEVTASCEDGIEKIELIYGGEVVQTANSETASFEVEESGWYQVKATSGKGKTRYANVRVSNEVGAPSIEITSNGESENDWYGKDNVPVEVTISTEEGNVSGIYYKKNTDTDYTYVEGRSTLVTINTSGRTVIYAYAVDGRGNESDIVRIEVKYDNVAPQVGAVAVSPELPASGWYNTDVVLSLPNMTDANSGIAGYYYWEVVGDVAEVPDEEKTYVSGASKTLTVKSEGIKMLAFQAIDKAGNKSGISNITVQKDSTNPKDFSLNIINDTTTQFTVNTGTTDDTTYTTDVSGMNYYEVYIDGNLVETAQVADQSTPSISYVASNLQENTTYTVYVVAYDKAGNKTESASMTVSTANVNPGGGGGQEPSKQLLAPMISLTGATQTNGYYTGNIIVTIQDSANINSTRATGIKYSVSGANAISETVVNDRIATFTITADGTSTIIAYTIDKDGNASDTSTQTVSKDTMAPNDVSISVTSYDRTSISVVAHGNDNGSGIANYEFQLSMTDNDADFETIETINNSTDNCTYIYSNLTMETTYYLRVIVTDRLGNSTISEKIERETQGKGITDETMSESIGKYVDYEPTRGNFTSSGAYNGYGTLNFSTISDIQWQIFYVEDDILTLIPEVTVNTDFYLSGANGYNNGVKLLNDACKAMYSNSMLGATARNLKIEDIERISTFDTTNIGKQESSTDERSYPNIFAQELNASINGRYSGTLKQSEQTTYITGISTATILAGKATDYIYTLSTNYIDSAYFKLLNNSKDYWLATRTFRYVNEYFYYGIYHVEDNSMSIEDLYRSSPREYSLGWALRPIVEINLSKVNIGELGDGSRNSQYSITAK